MQIVFDASDYERLRKIFAAMPKDIQKVAFGRAAARSRSVVERNYARFASMTLKVAQRHIKKRMESELSGADIIMDVKSTNIPLQELGASQNARGVVVRGRAQYVGAFIGSPKSKRETARNIVLLRKGKAGRLPTEMLFGPSPANAILRKPADYEDLLAEIAANEFAKTILQQVSYLIGKAG